MFRNVGTSVSAALSALIIVAVVGLFVLPGAAQAQHTVSGTITFQGLSQAPYPIAIVDLIESGTSNTADQVATDPATGEFVFTDVAGGNYELSVFAPCWGIITVAEFLVFGDGSVGTFEMPASTSDFTTIQLLGDFNGWNLGGVESMTFDGSCTWVDTLTLQPGTYNCKFVTDGGFDNPPDYGGDQGQTRTLPGGPFTTFLVTGEGTAHNVTVAVAGDYIFTLNEAMGSFTVTFEGSLPTGGISGTVAFAGVTTAPFPAATVKLFENGSTTVLRTTTSDPTTREFSFETVANGSYDLEVSANCFATQTRTAVAVSGSSVDLGEISLAAGTSPFASIHLVGEFTGWDVGSSPAMTQDETCVWSTSILLTPATYFFKMVTDGGFDNDYGGDESTLLTAPGTFTVKSGVFGGDAIKMEFTVEDTYTFTLDESKLTLTVTGTVPVERVSWGTIKSKY